MSEYGPSMYGSGNHRSGSGRWKSVVLALVFLALLAGVAGLGYLYWQTQKQLAYLASPAGQEELTRREAQTILDQLGELVVLPDESDPIIATITDQAALAAESPFYAAAINGDRLVIFPQSQRAYIFSPSRNRVVNIGPLEIESDAELDSGLEAQSGSEVDDESSDRVPVATGSAGTSL